MKERFVGRNAGARARVPSTDLLVSAHPRASLHSGGPFGPLFLGIVRKGRWEFITQAQEEKARCSTEGEHAQIREEFSADGATAKRAVVDNLRNFAKIEPMRKGRDAED